VELPAPLLERLQRLAQAGIEIVPAPGLERYLLLGKDGYFALAERLPDGFGSLGSPGIITPHGFAPLICGDTGCTFVCKSYRQEASPEQVAGARAFFTQLKQALS
jgi:hypothetical protein